MLAYFGIGRSTENIKIDMGGLYEAYGVRLFVIRAMPSDPL
jgi:hypothetical protein